MKFRTHKLNQRYLCYQKLDWDGRLERIIIFDKENPNNYTFWDGSRRVIDNFLFSPVESERYIGGYGYKLTDMACFGRKIPFTLAIKLIPFIKKYIECPEENLKIIA